MEQGSTARRTLVVGRAGEDAAEEFLRSSGYKIIDRHVVLRHGEIDIIAEDGPVLVFVEVKTRLGGTWDEVLLSLTRKKQELLRRTAEFYVQKHKITDRNCRFDVVAVLVTNGAAEIRIFKEAFY